MRPDETDPNERDMDLGPLEPLLAELAQDYHQPPATPAEEIWGEIRAARVAGARDARRGAPPYRWVMAGGGLLAAAVTTLLLVSLPAGGDRAAVRNALASDLAETEHILASMEAGEALPPERSVGVEGIAWLGFTTCADRIGLPADGVYICALPPDGPLARSGVRAGDLLVALDGIPIKNPAEMYERLFGLQEGQEVRIQIEADGRVLERSVTLEPRETGGAGALDMAWSPALHHALAERLGSRTGAVSGADTVVITSVAPADTVQVDDITVRWRRTGFRPAAPMALAGDRLVVAERTRVHILRVATEGWDEVTTGPRAGAFGAVASVAALGPDSVAVLDAAGPQLTLMSAEYGPTETREVTLRRPFINLRHSGGLTEWDGGYFLQLVSAVASGRVTRYALAWMDPVADTTAILFTWDGEILTDLGGVFGPPALFAPFPRVAVGPGPIVAVGDGLEYCITVRSLAGTGEPVRRLCRDRPRASVGEGIRQPDFTVLPEGSWARRMAERVADAQEVPDLLPSFDRLLWADDGSLWVRTIGPELSDIHPSVLAGRPDLGPSHREWDIFDREGRLVRTMRLPARFDPQVIADEFVYGFVQAADGQIVVGEIRL